MLQPGAIEASYSFEAEVDNALRGATTYGLDGFCMAKLDMPKLGAGTMAPIDPNVEAALPFFVIVSFEADQDLLSVLDLFGHRLAPGKTAECVALRS